MTLFAVPSRDWGEATLLPDFWSGALIVGGRAVLFAFEHDRDCKLDAGEREPHEQHHNRCRKGTIFIGCD